MLVLQHYTTKPNPNGQRNITKSLNVSDVENTTITDDAAQQEYRISVKVTDQESSDPIRGAVVTFTNITDKDVIFKSGQTGSAGGCTAKVMIGSYTVTAMCDGYEDYVHPDVVNVTDDATLVIEMTANGKGQ